jgi:hypothetical protein
MCSDLASTPPPPDRELSFGCWVWSNESRPDSTVVSYRSHLDRHYFSNPNCGKQSMLSRSKAKKIYIPQQVTLEDLHDLHKMCKIIWKEQAHFLYRVFQAIRHQVMKVPWPYPVRLGLTSRYTVLCRVRSDTGWFSRLRCVSVHNTLIVHSGRVILVPLYAGREKTLFLLCEFGETLGLLCAPPSPG